jgi:SagB-type dehydrogenase family enzyme
MTLKIAFLAAIGFYCAAIFPAAGGAEVKTSIMPGQETETIQLPEPEYAGSISIEEALLKRRSVRSYKDGPLTIAEVSQLLWAAQGITDRGGLRTAPSAGALYPLELYIAAGRVTGLPEGVYKYKPHDHKLTRVVKGDKRNELCNAALGQSPVKTAPAVIVFAAVYERTTLKYGDRGVQYVHIETGHAAQNVSLQAAALNLGTVAIGAFHDDLVRKVMNMADRERPLYIMPVGRLK